MLKIDDLHVSYGGIRALRGISLEVPDGKIVTLIGANGAGKSTTLRTISGLVKADSGSVTYDGQELLGKPINKVLEAGIAPTVGLGFRSGGDAFYLEEFGKLGCRLMVATEDGSLGTKGFVTDLARHVPECGYAFVCGPTPMLKAVHGLPQLTGGQFSFEARMGCGFGACMGCSVPTVNGYKRVCKDGPILYKEETVW